MHRRPRGRSTRSARKRASRTSAAASWSWRPVTRRSRVSARFSRAGARQWPDPRRLAGAELREPSHVAGVAGLWVTETGIVDYKGRCGRPMRACRRAGGTIRTGWRLAGRSRPDIRTHLGDGGEHYVRVPGHLRGLAGGSRGGAVRRQPGRAHHPFRGEYYELSRRRAIWCVISSIRCRTPSSRFWAYTSRARSTAA